MRLLRGPSNCATGRVGRINRTLAIIAVLPKQFRVYCNSVCIDDLCAKRVDRVLSEYFVEVATVFTVIAIRVLPLVSSL